MYTLRKPILSLVLVFVYFVILQNSVVNTLYTLYVQEGSKAKPVVKEQRSESKKTYRWSIRVHTNDNVVKYSYTPSYLKTTFTLSELKHFSVVKFEDVPSLYESFEFSLTNGRSPPIS